MPPELYGPFGLLVALLIAVSVLYRASERQRAQERTDWENQKREMREDCAKRELELRTEFDARLLEIHQQDEKVIEQWRLRAERWEHLTLLQTNLAASLVGPLPESLSKPDVRR